MQWLYKYPQAAFPYRQLLEENRRRGYVEREFELADSGVFDDGDYFDVLVTYAKASPEDLCVLIEVTNRARDAAAVHVLPTIWFRNTWSWGRDDRRPRLHADREGRNRIIADHGLIGRRWLIAGSSSVEPRQLFCENETNHERVHRTRMSVPYPKDGIND